MAQVRRPTAIAAAIATVMLAVPACASGFDYTHRLKMTVEYRYDWSTTPKDTRCRRSGSGFFHVNASTKSVRVNAGFNRTAGRFLIGVPYGKRAIRDLPPQRLLGSYEMANDAPFVGEDCADLNANDTDRSDCGTKPLPKTAQLGGSTGSSDTPTKIEVRVGSLTRAPFDGHCEQMGVFDVSWLGFKPLFLKAPSARKLRKSSVTLQASETRHPDFSDEGLGSGTATRTVRFVFTRL